MVLRALRFVKEKILLRRWHRRERPSLQPEPDRYEGRPLILVLDNYVLATLGQLSEDQEAGTADLVRQVFGGGPDWRSTVRATLGLGPGFDDEIRSLFERNRAVAKRLGDELHAVHFAKKVVDESFRHLLDTEGGGKSEND